MNNHSCNHWIDHSLLNAIIQLLNSRGNMIVCVLKDVKFMKKQTLSESNFELWLLFGKAHHSLELARQRELNQYHIPFRRRMFSALLKIWAPMRPWPR